MDFESDDILMHYGMPRRSGRYPWGSGEDPVHMEQLMIYAALFCLEYNVRPGDIEIELRIYQNDEVDFYIPTVDEIAHIMGTIVHLDKLTAKFDEED